MILARWRIIKTEYGKEQVVAHCLKDMGFETFVPVEMRSYVRHKGKRWTDDVTMIPATVFVLAELSAIEFDIPRLRYVAGIERDTENFPEVIPFEEMAAFREAYSKWFAAAHKRLQDGKSPVGRGKGAKFQDFASAAAYLKAQQDRKDAA